MDGKFFFRGSRCRFWSTNEASRKGREFIWDIQNGFAHSIRLSSRAYPEWAWKVSTLISNEFWFWMEINFKHIASLSDTLLAFSSQPCNEKYLSFSPFFDVNDDDISLSHRKKQRAEETRNFCDIIFTLLIFGSLPSTRNIDVAERGGKKYPIQHKTCASNTLMFTSVS